MTSGKLGSAQQDVGLRAIQTEYHGYLFRSRLEARWAVFFDALGLKWEYEAEGYELPSGRYLPDFKLPDYRMFVEVKPQPPLRDSREVRVATELSHASGLAVVIASGDPYGAFVGTWLAKDYRRVVSGSRDFNLVASALPTGITFNRIYDIGRGVWPPVDIVDVHLCDEDVAYAVELMPHGEDVWGDAYSAVPLEELSSEFDFDDHSGVKSALAEAKKHRLLVRENRRALRDLLDFVFAAPKGRVEDAARKARSARFEHGARG